MQRYFVTPEQIDGSRIVLAGDDAHHITRVMRMEEDDVIIISDGVSRVAEATIKSLSPGKVEAEAEAWLPIGGEPVWSVTIAQSLPKGDKMELVIQKGTEIGAAAFVPFESQRMIVQYDGKKEAKRLERWGKIAKEAAEQAHRSRIPAIDAVATWKELIARIPSFDLALFCYEKEGGGHGLREAVAACRQDNSWGGEERNILLVVGPEGGFTEREAEEAEEAGAVVVGLGKRILRTETAAMVGLACLMYESGEMGGV
ncbi:16S rRNA (uracil(1498)-N(3))-methyltransferase [Paenibacillus rhizovicinus]|uniref:Ribosomal RNA small subunit methyltransferase E n=1 Tax=Paenibacillus rhizovicinus TaxID=2704463 RepID=A0A6C0P145_9BACL|nr:RsmE family RNA methyltransferase [Paenibacillus rhizovicinus]QHW30452.1 16S rRNA (uracil(1498)-N(3))-methyltransferase [Paenibacillus rhizovicinus]